MPLETSVVSIYACNLMNRSLIIFKSIGTAFFSTGPTGPMALHSLPSAHFFRTKHSSTDLTPLVRRERTGTTHIIQLNIVMDFEGLWLFTILRTL